MNTNDALWAYVAWKNFFIFYITTITSNITTLYGCLFDQYSLVKLHHFRQYTANCRIYDAFFTVHMSNKTLPPVVWWPGLLTILSNSIADIDTDTFCQKYRRNRYRYVREKLPRYFCRYFYRYFLLM